MTRLVAAALVAVALAACQSSGSSSAAWCQANSKSDFVRTPAERAAQSPADRRNDLRQLELGARLCGWKR